MSNSNTPTVTNLNPYQGNQVAEQLPLASNAIVSVETQRAIAEVQAQVMMAIQFPRDPASCVDKMLNECQRKSFAEKALFSYARGGTTIDGLTIRSLEMIARNWRNIKFGYRCLDRRNGVSYLQAYAYDLESNVPISREFQVKHWRDTKKGGYLLKDERDIYELEANQAQRRVRSCIEALIPSDIKDAVFGSVQNTLNTHVDITPEGLKAMLGVFERFGVNKKMVEARIQRKMASIEPAQAVSLRKIVVSLKDEMSNPEDWFDIKLQDKASVKKVTAKEKKETISQEKKTENLADFKEKNADKSKPVQEAKPAANEVKKEETVNPETGEIKEKEAPKFACHICEDTGIVYERDGNGNIEDQYPCDCKKKP